MNFELRRKLAHILFGTVLMVIVWFSPEYKLRPILAGVLLLGIVLSLIERKRKLPLLTPLLHLFERKRHRNVFPGRPLIMLLAATMLTELFFNKILIVSGLIVVTYGDSVAHLIGKRFGHWKIPWDTSKHVEGRVAGVLVSWVLLILFWQTTILGAPYVALLVAATIGMLVESLPLQKIGLDDNLVVPFVVAVALYVQF